MTNELILDFLDFPPDIVEFQDYESKIHQQIESQFNDTRALILTIMKELPVNKRKNLFKLKKFVDQLKSGYLEIKSSSFVIVTEEDDQNLTFNHEIILILDFLIFERLIDFNGAVRELEQSLLYSEDEDLFDVHLMKLHKSLQKLEELLNIRKFAHQISPSHQLFQKFSDEFGGQLSYLESVGVIRQFDNLSKPTIFRKKAYKRQLAQLVTATLSRLQEQEKTTVLIYDFIDAFSKRYPNVEYDFKDIEEILTSFYKSNIIGLTEDTENSPKQIILGKDTQLQKEIIDLAKKKGYITQEEMISSLGKSIEEIQVTIKKLEDAGLAIEDEDYATGSRYYFPGMEMEKRKE